MYHLVTRGEVLQYRLHVEGATDDLGELEDRVGRVRADVVDLVAAFGYRRRPGNDRRHVPNVRESPRLATVTEHRQRLTLQHVVHEDPDHVSVTVGDVLALSIDIVRPKDGVLEAEHLMGRREIQLDRVLRDPVRVLRTGHHLLRHWRLPGPV